MKIRRGWMVVCGLICCNAFAATLDLRPGNWEVVSASSVSSVTIPPDALAKMPPDQRAKFDAAMKARVGKVNTTTTQACVTKQDLETGNLMKSDRDNCSRKVIEQTARRLEVEETCAAPDASQTHVTFDSKSPQAYTATVDRQGEAGKFHIEMTGRWLDAKCPPEDDDED